MPSKPDIDNKTAQGHFHLTLYRRREMFYKQRNMTVLLLVVLSVTASVAQTIYYVDGTNGNDSNDGTSTLAAFKSIQKCASIVVAGDTCSIRGGTYRETITPAHSGTFENPITFAPYATNETVIISGADVVPGPWTVSSGNIYTTQSMSWNVEAFNGSTVSANQLFVDGVMMPEARWPNIDPAQVTMVRFEDMAQMQNATVPTTTQATFFDSGLTQTYWTGGFAFFSPGYAWGSYTCGVSASRVGSVDINCQNINGAQAPTFVAFGSGTDAWTPQGGNYFYLFGVPQALDAPGEWFFDPTSNTLSLWTADSSNPANHLIETKARLYAFDLTQRSYITISGLSIVSASVHGPFTSNIILRELDISYGAHTMQVPSYSHGEFFTASVSFYPGNYNHVLDSTITYSAGAAILSSGVANLVQNNVISQVSYVALQTGIRMLLPNITWVDIGSNRSTVIQNTVFSGGVVLIQIGDGLNIKYNDAYYSHYQRADLAVMYGFNGQGHDAEIDHNWAHDCFGALNSTLKYNGCTGVYLDNSCNNYKVYRNVAWNGNPQAWNYQTMGQMAPYEITKNNVWAYNTGPGYMSMSTSQAMTNNLGENNIIQYKAVNPGFNAVHNFDPTVTDPFFVDAANHDYHLRPYSPAIGGAIRLGAPYDDQVPSTKTPDYGAYDTELPDWLPGAMIRASDLANLIYTCESTSSGTSIDCTIEGLPQGRKLPLGFSLNVGPASGPTGTAGTCVTNYNYPTSQGTGFCTNIVLPSGANQGSSWNIYVQSNSTSGTWSNTGSTVTIQGLQIFSVQPGCAAGGTNISIFGSAFPFGQFGSWRYTSTISINGPGNRNLQDYPVLAIVDTATPIAANQMRPDCADVSFADAYTSLPYWIESGCNSTSTRFWVKITYIVASGVTNISMFYGDLSDDVSNSNGNDVFLMFDDFTNGVLASHFTLTSADWYTTSVSNGQIQLTGLIPNASLVNNQPDFMYVGYPTGYSLRALPNIAVDSEYSLLNNFTNWKGATGSAETGLVGTITNGQKLIQYYNGKWNPVGSANVPNGPFLSKKFTIWYEGSGTGARNIVWFQDGNFNTQIGNYSSPTNSLGGWWFSPEIVGEPFTVLVDNVRFRPFNQPDPSPVTVGPVVSAPNFVEVLIGGQPCLDVVVMNWGEIQCLVPPSVDSSVVQVITESGTATNYCTSSAATLFRPLATSLLY